MTYGGMNISLIIPALNEAACIGPLLAELPTGMADEVILVDNGSSDGTAAAAAGAGAQVVSEPRHGYGYACAAGAAAASSELLVFMDGDGSFVPSELMRLAAPLQSSEAGLVLGTRMAGGMSAGAMPPHQLAGNKLVARILRTFYGIQVTDLGPFRAIRRDLLLQFAMQEHTYGWPVEMMVKAARYGVTMVEVPVTYRPRLAGQSKVGGSLRASTLATYRILRVTLRYAR